LLYHPIEPHVRTRAIYKGITRGIPEGHRKTFQKRKKFERLFSEVAATSREKGTRPGGSQFDLYGGRPTVNLISAQTLCILASLFPTTGPRLVRTLVRTRDNSKIRKRRRENRRGGRVRLSFHSTFVTMANSGRGEGHDPFENF